MDGFFQLGFQLTCNVSTAFLLVELVVIKLGHHVVSFLYQQPWGWLIAGVNHQLFQFAATILDRPFSVQAFFSRNAGLMLRVKYRLVNWNQVGRFDIGKLPCWNMVVFGRPWCHLDDLDSRYRPLPWGWSSLCSSGCTMLPILFEASNITSIENLLIHFKC